MQDVQALVLWVLADGANPRWVFVKACPSAAPALAIADSWQAEDSVRALPAALQAVMQPLVCA